MAKKEEKAVDPVEMPEGGTVQEAAVQNTAQEDEAAQDTEEALKEEPLQEETVEVTVVELPEEEAPATVRVVVLKRFMDKLDRQTYYEAGAEAEFDPERAANLIGRGLARPKEQ